MKPKNEDAEVIEVDVGGEKKKIVMAPGRVIYDGIPDQRFGPAYVCPRSGSGLSRHFQIVNFFSLSLF